MTGYTLFFAASLCLAVLQAAAQPAGSNVVVAKQGFSMKTQMDNTGTFGRQAYDPPDPATSTGLLGLEYPVGQPYEHLFGAGIWVGGLLDTARVGTSPPIRAVSTAYEGWSGPLNEFFPSSSSADTIFRINGKNAPKPAAWDAYWGGAIPYKPISDNDFYMTYSDYFYRAPNPANHLPLNLKVIQSSFVWNDTYADAIMIVEYKIINMGTKVIDSAYVGFFFEADVGPLNAALYYQRNFTGYYPNSRTAYIHNPVDLGSTPVGCSLLSTSLPLDSLRYTFQWYPGPQSPANDGARYNTLSSGQIKADEFPSLSDTRFLFGFGPFFIRPSNNPVQYPNPDTLKIAMAFISGYDPVGNHLRILQRNASRALDIYLNQGIRLPATPPSPPLRAEVGFRRVTLDWRWTPVDSTGPNGRPDPEGNWDSTNQVARRYPDRIANPPPGYNASRGGRNFESYKVWRSENEGGVDEAGQLTPPPDNSFVLVKQIDVPTDSFEYNSGELPYNFDGLKPYAFIDSNLVRGKTYWYSVTSKSIPNLAYQQIVIGGQVVTVEVPVDPLESRIATNAVPIKPLPFSVSQEPRKVAVVPNPYRTDKDYTLESGGWEGTNSSWQETNRLIKFINLPERCVIRVFSLSGDLVRTIQHDGGAGAFPRGDHDMPLLSESNRALASGLYIFTVESELGVQTGKFVIIR